MTGSYSDIRKKHKAPQTKLLMLVFFVTLILVVANQALVQVHARQGQVHARQIADLRVLALDLAGSAAALAAGSSTARDQLANARSGFESAWTLLNTGRPDSTDIAFGYRTGLPGQQQEIQQNHPALLQVWNRTSENTRQLLGDSGQLNALAVANIAADAAVLQEHLIRLGEQLGTGGRVWFASPLTGFALLLVLLLTIGLYGWQVIRKSREAEQHSAEKHRYNNQAVLKLIGEISGLADGDLTVEATVSEDFTGPIADAINYAVGQLRELVAAITAVTLDVMASTDSSAEQVEALTEASRRQSKSIDSVYDSIREIGAAINLVSDHARKSLSVAETSVLTAAGGAEVVKDTIRGMDSIRDQIQDTAKRIKRLGESSQEIGGFVALINDIAAHTNTLSLNAAIQAASAGDAGKGFAVVADEVHALAQRSGDATRKIESLVKVIQGDIKEAVQSMEQTTTQVVAGTGLALRAGKALDDIQQVSRDLAELVSNISVATHNQTKAASQLSGSMQVIKQVTGRTAEGIEETREFMLKLGDLTGRLKKAVAGFSLDREAKWTKLKKAGVTAMDAKLAQKRPGLEIDKGTAGKRKDKPEAGAARIMSA